MQRQSTGRDDGIVGCMDQESLRDIQSRLKHVGDLLESASQAPDSRYFAREAKRVLRNVTDTIEIKTERCFTSIEAFVQACEDLQTEDPEELPSDIRPRRGDMLRPWFQPFEDARRRVLGVQEILSGDRLTMPLTALKEAPPEWKALVSKFVKPEGRKLLADALTRGEYPGVL